MWCVIALWDRLVIVVVVVRCGAAHKPMAKRSQLESLAKAECISAADKDGSAGAAAAASAAVSHRWTLWYLNIAYNAWLLEWLNKYVDGLMTWWPRKFWSSYTSKYNKGRPCHWQQLRAGKVGPARYILWEVLRSLLGTETIGVACSTIVLVCELVFSRPHGWHCIAKQ